MKCVHQILTLDSLKCKVSLTYGVFMHKELTVALI
jgi:hypothetical protein